MTLSIDSLAQKLKEFAQTINSASHPLNGGNADELLLEGAKKFAKAIYEDLSKTIVDVDKPRFDGAEKKVNFGKIELDENGIIYAKNFVLLDIPPPISGGTSGDGGGGSGGSSGGDGGSGDGGGPFGGGNIIGPPVAGMNNESNFNFSAGLISGTFSDPSQNFINTESGEYYGVEGGGLYDLEEQDIYGSFQDLLTGQISLQSLQNQISNIQQTFNTYNTYNTGSGSGSGTSISGIDNFTRVFTYEKQKPSADTPDDYFLLGDLSPKWNVVTGSSGAVDIFGSGGGIYDLHTMKSGIIFQAKTSNSVRMRQDYTLDDQEVIFCSFSPALSMESILNNCVWYGFALNDNDSDPESGNWVSIFLDARSSTYRFISYNGSTSYDLKQPFGVGHKFVGMIARSGTEYFPYVSIANGAPVPLGSFNPGTVLDNLWIFGITKAALPSPSPTCVFDWVKKGSAENIFDPWRS